MELSEYEGAAGLAWKSTKSLASIEYVEDGEPLSQTHLIEANETMGRAKTILGVELKTETATAYREARAASAVSRCVFMLMDDGLVVALIRDHEIALRC